MRYDATLIAALGALLLVGPAAAAQTTQTVIEDPSGDAGPAATEIGEAAADVDILSVDFSTEEGQTSAEMELASFDTRPPETVWAVAYELDGDSFVWFGYGKPVFPSQEIVHEGFYGCHLTDEDENCTLLEGEIRSDLPGFAVEIPQSWAPANASLEEPMAATFHDPFLPGPANEAWWQAVWPHNAEDTAGPGDTYEVPDDESQDGEDDVEAAAGGQAEASESLEFASVGGSALAGVGLFGLVGLGLRRS